MLRALIELQSDQTSVQEQILSGSKVPTLEDVSAKLLHLSITPNDATETDSSKSAVAAIETG